MKITQSGFYDISDTSDKEIILSDNIEVIIFDNTAIPLTIIVGNKVNIKYFGFFHKDFIGNKHILMQGTESHSEVRILTTSIESKLKLTCLGQLANSHNYLNIDIIALIGYNGEVDIDGQIQIDENIEKVEGYLHQTNIFLSDTGKAKGIPTLLVRSNDVKAAHGCNIERISDDKLFYMRSRGIGKDEAVRLMIGSYFERVFSSLRETQDEFVEKLITDFQERI